MSESSGRLFRYQAFGLDIFMADDECNSFSETALRIMHFDQNKTTEVSFNFR